AEQGVVYPFFGFIGITFGGDDVKIAENDGGCALLKQLRCMFFEALYPAHFVIKLRSGVRVSVRQINAADGYTVDDGFEVAALYIILVAGQYAGHLGYFLFSA